MKSKNRKYKANLKKIKEDCAKESSANYWLREKNEPHLQGAKHLHSQRLIRPQTVRLEIPSNALING